ncbi:diaminopimelate decarboxylase [soil metagenome]
MGGASEAFPRVNGVLRVGSGEGGVSLEALAEEHGTPLYVYSADAIGARVRAYQEAFGGQGDARGQGAPGQDGAGRDAEGVDFLLAYSVNANGNLAVLNRIAALGAGADIVSGGELARALAAGIPGERIVFAGVGKTDAELRAGLEAGIHAFHVESAGELEALERVALAMSVRAPVGIRVNPNIHTDTPHEYTRTGHAATKFGIAGEQAMALYREAAGRPALELKGIDVHIGSQIIEVEPYRRALDTVLAMVDELAAEGIALEYLDLGGGFGVGYEGGPGLTPARVAEAVVGPLRDRGLRLLLEPGRSISGEAGVLLTRVLYVKEAGGKTFAITDAGMTELLRPSHYDGWHRIEAVRERPGAPEATVEIVGPVCETGDFLARGRQMPVPEPGELLAVATAGAYGFAMASNYNARPRPAEVLVEGGVAHLVRRRETLEDLYRGETIPPHPDPNS